MLIVDGKSAEMKANSKVSKDSPWVVEPWNK